MFATTTADLPIRRHSRRSAAALLAMSFALAIDLLAACTTHADDSQPTSAESTLIFATEYDPFDPPPATNDIIQSDPFEAQPAVYDPFEETPYVLQVVAPAPALMPPNPILRRSASELFDTSSKQKLPPSAPIATPSVARPLHRLVAHQPEPLPPQEGTADETLPDPCFVEAQKRPTDLTINIGMPPGEFPKDFAAACWQQIDAQAGPSAAARYWPTFNYQWNATAFCHQPLYFEEVNLERYGYGCCACLQPAVSAAHFFGTVPALPYCMVANCPSECIYTLGYYRPGSCPPWQNNYPPCIGVK